VKKLSASLTSWGMATLAFCILAPWQSRAEDTRLLAVGVRAGFSGSSPIGEETQQYFQQYDVMASVGLPWEWYSESGWGMGTRFLATAGAVTAAGDTAFISTFVPGVALGSKDGRISLEVGAGIALLSDYKFGNQNMGGPFQFVWDIGLRSAVYRSIGVGYWFQHISDAFIYGGDSRGYDLHMIELSYRY